MTERPPLELTAYPFDGVGYQLPNEWVPAGDADEAVAEKRLTEPELAAEYYAAHGDGNALLTGNLVRLGYSRRAALRRFAILPHAAEHGYE